MTLLANAASVATSNSYVAAPPPPPTVAFLIVSFTGWLEFGIDRFAAGETCSTALTVTVVGVGVVGELDFLHAENASAQTRHINRRKRNLFMKKDRGKTCSEQADIVNQGMPPRLV